MATAQLEWTFDQAAEALSEWRGTIGAFTRRLDREGLPYLSYSRLAAVTFCPQRYLLEYVERVRLRPEPRYFVKGRLLHEAAAKLHRARRRGRRISLDQLVRPAQRRLDETDVRHLRNALELMSQQTGDGWEVVAVEEPFVLDLGRGLPPCMGVVDLVLRRNDHFAVIDHKGCRQFNEPDNLQLVLYREYVRRQYGAQRCFGYVDQYRWVNNLARIRVPAFDRTRVPCGREAWRLALRSITETYCEIQEIEATGRAAATGNCVVCPFKDRCPEASFGYGGWW